MTPLQRRPPGPKLNMGSHNLGGANLPKDLSLEGTERSVDALQLSVRASNCLKQAGIQTVGQLMQWTEVQLLRLPNLGVRTLREIRAALQSFREASQNPYELELRAPSVQAEARGSDKGHGEVGELPARPIVDGRHAILAFSRALTARERSVLQHRVFRSDITLEDLGQRFAVTRERIRQIEVRLIKRFRSYLANPDASSIDVCACEFRALVGRAAPIAAFEQYCKKWAQLDGVSDADRELLAASIGWIAGPYSECDGWACVADYSAQEITDSLLEARDGRGWISPEAAHQVLERTGINFEFEDHWLTDHRFRSMDGGWLRILRNMPDQVEQILQFRGVPMTTEELYRFVESDSERSLRNRLNDDARFMRVSRQGHFALREWRQYEEYSGIAAEIAEEIERQGGAADSQYLIDVLSARFGVRRSSVYQYLSAPMFVKERSGRVRMRTGEEAIAVRADPTLCQALYRVNQQWRFRTEITRETVRGSGRPLPTAVAALVGCLPGGRMVLRSPADDIVVSWPPGSASGPNLGSLRPALESLGGQVGDYLFLTIVDQSMEVTLLRAESVANGSALDRLLLLVGLSPGAQSEATAWATIGSAIGLDARDGVPGPEEVHAQLVRRNEIELARLVREISPHAVESILDRLEGSLGL